MFVDPLELVLLGARMANRELKDVITDDLFTGELAALVAPPENTIAGRLRDWLKHYGVKWVVEEKPLDAIVRTLAYNRDRRAFQKDIRETIRQATCGDIRSVTELRGMLDKFLSHSDPAGQ